MGILFFVLSSVALFVQVFGAAVALYAVSHRSMGVTDAVLLISLAASALLVAYGHLIFIALLYRRLQRQGTKLRLPNAVGRVLARLMENIQI